MADQGAVYVAGAVRLSAGAGVQPLLACADGSLSVAVAPRANGAELTITNSYGAPLTLNDASGELACGDTPRSLVVPPTGAMLALQATGDGGSATGGESRPAATLFVSAEHDHDGILVIGQLLVRRLELASPAA